MVGQALTRVVDAAGMAQVIGEKIRRDPLYLIEVFTPSKRNKIGEKK
jgi:hypothetical protein